MTQVLEAAEKKATVVRPARSAEWLRWCLLALAPRGGPKSEAQRRLPFSPRLPTLGSPLGARARRHFRSHPAERARNFMPRSHRAAVARLQEDAGEAQHSAGSQGPCVKRAAVQEGWRDTRRSPTPGLDLDAEHPRATPGPGPAVASAGGAGVDRVVLGILSRTSRPTRKAYHGTRFGERN